MNGSSLDNKLIKLMIDSFFVFLGGPSREDAYGVTRGLQPEHTVRNNRFSVYETQRFSRNCRYSVDFVRISVRFRRFFPTENRAQSHGFARFLQRSKQTAPYKKPHYG